jgi:hypothetical protein
LVIAVLWTRIRRPVDGAGRTSVVVRERVEVEVLKMTAFCCLGRVVIVETGSLELRYMSWMDEK